uniref:Uncharacterized protein n=1 Tax=Arundo donax TaxID=35708 RepID=A0A0A8Y2W2_ARUDO
MTKKLCPMNNLSVVIYHNCKDNFIMIIHSFYPVTTYKPQKCMAC